MTKTESDIIVLDGIPAMQGGLGKLVAYKSGGGDEAVPFALLDCHDGSIRKAGRVLIEAGGMLMLYGRDIALTQPARRAGNFVADLEDGPVKYALRKTSPLRSLLVVGTGTLSRDLIALVDNQGKTRARAELSLLYPAGAGRAATLAQLDHLRGYGKAHAALGAHLRGPNHHTIADLEEMLFPEHQPYDPKPLTVITPEEPAYDAANDIIRAYLTVARRNEAGIIADHDSEFLHDYRVALRKIRSVISLFKGIYAEGQTQDLKRRFADLMAPTGRLRDLDVYLLEREAFFALLPPTLHDGLSLMFDIFAHERRQEHRKIAKLLESPAYQTAMAELEGLFARDVGPQRGPDAKHPAHDYACGLIWKRYRKVCKIAARIDDQTPDAQVHALRITCKKLRYLIELFAPLFPRAKVKALLAPLAELQDILGLFNDYSIQQVALQDFLAHHRMKALPDERLMATSVGALIALLHQRQMQERARIALSFQHFDSPAIRRDFAKLFRGKGA